jgi:hypothetical protein
MFTTLCCLLSFPRVTPYLYSQSFSYGFFSQTRLPLTSILGTQIARGQKEVRSELLYLFRVTWLPPCPTLCHLAVLESPDDDSHPCKWFAAPRVFRSDFAAARQTHHDGVPLGDEFFDSVPKVQLFSNIAYGLLERLSMRPRFSTDTMVDKAGGY